jgi:hypothetical protein
LALGGVNEVAQERRMARLWSPLSRSMCEWDYAEPPESVAATRAVTAPAGVSAVTAHVSEATTESVKRLGVGRCLHYEDRNSRWKSPSKPRKYSCMSSTSSIVMGGGSASIDSSGSKGRSEC